MLQGLKEITLVGCLPPVLAHCESLLMAAALLNWRAAFRTRPRTGSGSGVKVSPTPRSSGAGAPDLPSVPPTELCPQGQLKELPPALKSLPAFYGQSWACLCREGGWGLIASDKSKSRTLMFLPQGMFHTLEAGGGGRSVETSLWGASTCVRRGC